MHIKKYFKIFCRGFIKVELPRFPPNPPAIALINPLFLGKYLQAFLTEAVMEMAKPIPKKIFIKKSKIKFSLIVNNKSPKANKNPPSNMTNFDPKKCPIIPPKKQKILIKKDMKGWMKYPSL